MNVSYRTNERRINDDEHHQSKYTVFKRERKMSSHPKHTKNDQHMYKEIENQYNDRTNQKKKQQNPMNVYIYI